MLVNEFKMYWVTAVFCNVLHMCRDFKLYAAWRSPLIIAELLDFRHFPLWICTLFVIPKIDFTIELSGWPSMDLCSLWNFVAVGNAVATTVSIELPTVKGALQRFTFDMAIDTQVGA